MFKAINKRLKNKKGFTLVELIVVLAVLGVIAAIAVPNFTGIQKDAKIKADAATAMSIVKAARLQETAKGVAVNCYHKETYGEDDVPLNTEYFDNTVKPQSGDNFELSKNDDNNKYEVTWTTTDDDTYKYTEGNDEAEIITD